MTVRPKDAGDKRMLSPNDLGWARWSAQGQRALLGSHSLLYLCVRRPDTEVAVDWVVSLRHICMRTARMQAQVRFKLCSAPAVSLAMDVTSLPHVWRTEVAHSTAVQHSRRAS